MTTITLTFEDGEVDKFKMVLFAEEAFAALREIDAISCIQINNGPSFNDRGELIRVLDAARAVLEKVA